eukprot:c14368_g1_i1.p1 GENE.c14368_g1_i1~~c14368_g1_i1.p1  ORF type:complete len:226 (-),score=85.95 c14368_g1_i1:72-749(-)
MICCLWRTRSISISVLNLNLSRIQNLCVKALEEQESNLDFINNLKNTTLKAINLTKKKVINLEKQLKNKEEAERWKQLGDSLLAVSYKGWNKGMKEILVDDWNKFDENGNPIKISVTLNPEKNIHENAQECFKQSKKVYNAIEKVIPLLTETKNDFLILQNNEKILSDIYSQMVLKSISIVSQEMKQQLFQIQSQLRQKGFLFDPKNKEKFQSKKKILKKNMEKM